jgi:hypothetical protein
MRHPIVHLPRLIPKQFANAPFAAVGPSSAFVQQRKHGINEAMLKTYQGSCHCGKTRFEVDADLDHVRVCDCSICRRRGALLHRVEPHYLRVLTPIEDLATYSFNTHTAKDYFCKTCGILPFRQPRTGPGLWSVNIRCLPDVDLGAIPIKYVYGSRLS